MAQTIIETVREGSPLPVGAEEPPVGPGPAGREPAEGTATSPRRPAFGRWLPRTACHLAAELPLVVLMIAEMAMGWRPLSDNASIAWRAWYLFSGHFPLLGQYTVPNGTQLAHGLGPVQYWFLAVPVRLDPGQGALWAGFLACVLATFVVVEAGWSVARLPGAVLGSVAVSVLVLTRPDVVLVMPWNPTFGVFWLMAAIAAACATANGRLRWWPVAILAATVAAQCQEVFALSAVAACAIAPLLGWSRRRADESRLGRHWLAAGLGTTALLWVLPLIQEVTGNPGNLTLLWRATHSGGPRIGLGAALGGLGAAVRPFPYWWHNPPGGSALVAFFTTLESFDGPRGWAVIVLVGLALAAVVAWRKRWTALAAVTALAVVVDLAVVLSVADSPANSELKFAYLDVVWWPVGMISFVAAGAVIVAVLRPVVRRLWADRRSGAGRGSDRRSGAGWGSDRAGRAARWAGAALALGAGGAALAAEVPLLGPEMDFGGSAHVRTEQQLTAAVEQRAPHRPFLLRLGEGRLDLGRSGLLAGTAYALTTDGFQPRLDQGSPQDFGPWLVASPGLPTVTIHLGHDGTRLEGVTVSPSASPR